jgi:hypothetical protein
MRHDLRRLATPLKTALVVSIGFPEGIPVELALIKGLELAGFAPTVVAPRDRWITKYYKLAGVQNLVYWDDYLDPMDLTQAESILAELNSIGSLLAIQSGGARVGRFCASTTLRKLRTGGIDFESPRVRQEVALHLASALNYASAAERIVRELRPKTALFVDRGYTPQGEMFDICLNEGADVVTWNAAHKSNALILKRYVLENRDEHPASLSEESWHRVRTMEWTEQHRQRLQEELYESYASGDWYGEVGTQFNKRILGASELRERLGLDPTKKTAIIFPHILWDGTFF